MPCIYGPRFGRLRQGVSRIGKISCDIPRPSRRDGAHAISSLHATHSARVSFHIWPAQHFCKWSEVSGDDLLNDSYTEANENTQWVQKRAVNARCAKESTPTMLLCTLFKIVAEGVTPSCTRECLVGMHIVQQELLLCDPFTWCVERTGRYTFQSTAVYSAHLDKR